MRNTSVRKFVVVTLAAAFVVSAGLSPIHVAKAAPVTDAPDAGPDTNAFATLKPSDAEKTLHSLALSLGFHFRCPGEVYTVKQKIDRMEPLRELAEIRTAHADWKGASSLDRLLGFGLPGAVLSRRDGVKTSEKSWSDLRRGADPENQLAYEVAVERSANAPTQVHVKIMADAYTESAAFLTFELDATESKAISYSSRIQSTHPYDEYRQQTTIYEDRGTPLNPDIREIAVPAYWHYGTHTVITETSKCSFTDAAHN